MGFNRQCLGVIGTAANLVTEILQDGTINGAPQVFTYISLTDTAAEIAAADYFVELAPTVHVGDLFHAIGSDTGITLTVAGVTLGPPAQVITEQAVSAGNVDGPVSATDNALVRFNGATGKLIQNSAAILDDSSNLTGLNNVTASNISLTNTGSFTLPAGNTAQRAGGAGSLRFNSQTSVCELTEDGVSWSPISTSTSGVNSVSGTANRITSTGGVTPIIDISASYVGQSSITTLGTVTTGTWSATNIALNKGGTNASLTASNGGIVWSNATQMQILSGTATARQMLQSGATATPAWSTATWPATTTINRILYSSAANTVSEIISANNGTLVTGATGVPAILAGPGTTGNILQSNAAAAPSFSDASYPSTISANEILYSSSADVVTGLAPVNASVLTTTNTGVPAYVSLDDGQLVVGSTAGSPAAATLTAGTGIAITNASNSITIACTAAGMSTVVVSGTTQTMAVNTQYIADNAVSPVVFTLPATAAVGDVIRVLGRGAAGWSIAQTGSQEIILDDISTTSGVAGSLASTTQYNNVELICITANTQFTCLGPVGYFTVT